MNAPGACLKKLFEQVGTRKTTRAQLIAEAVYKHGHSEIEVALHLRFSIRRNWLILIKVSMKQQG